MDVLPAAAPKVAQEFDSGEKISVFSKGIRSQSSIN